MRSRARTAKVKAPQLSRPPLLRMVRLDEQLRSGRFPNCRKLAAELEVSPKTIQRDLDFMRDQMKLPIEYDQLHFGFVYNGPVPPHLFAAFQVTEGELVALFVAQKALEQYRGTPYEAPLRAAFGKITTGLQESVAFPWSSLDAAISFRGLGTTVADLELFEIVSQAVLHSRELTLDYKKLGGARHETRRVQPYHLGCVENQWYLFAFDLARRQLRTFALPRMRRVRDTGTTFHRPADFSITEHLSNSFGVFKSGGQARHRVRLRFDPFATRLVSERHWHPTQKLKPLPEGRLELTLTLGSLEEIERWILSWGAHVQVLDPPELKARIRKTAEAILKG